MWLIHLSRKWVEMTKKASDFSTHPSNVSFEHNFINRVVVSKPQIVGDTTIIEPFSQQNKSPFNPKIVDIH